MNQLIGIKDRESDLKSSALDAEEVRSYTLYLAWYAIGLVTVVFAVLSWQSNAIRKKIFAYREERSVENNL